MDLWARKTLKTCRLTRPRHRRSKSHVTLPIGRPLTSTRKTSYTPEKPVPHQRLPSRPAVFLLPFTLAQFHAPDLAADRLGQFGHELDFTRVLVRRGHRFDVLL